jgi:hypothetical protein
MAGFSLGKCFATTEFVQAFTLVLPAGEQKNGFPACRQTGLHKAKPCWLIILGAFTRKLPICKKNMGKKFYAIPHISTQSGRIWYGKAFGRYSACWHNIFKLLSTTGTMKVARF